MVVVVVGLAVDSVVVSVTVGVVLVLILLQTLWLPGDLQMILELQ